MEKEQIDEYVNAATKFSVETDIEHEVMKTQDELFQEYITECRKNEKGITFGIPLLDTITGSMFPGQILGIIAGPGTYKTVTAQNLVVKSLPCLTDEQFAGIFTMEMSATRELQRRIQIKTGWSKKFIREGAKKEEDYFLRAMEEMKISQDKIMTCDRNNLNIEQIVKIIQNEEWVGSETTTLSLVNWENLDGWTQQATASPNYGTPSGYGSATVYDNQLHHSGVGLNPTIRYNTLS